MTRYLSGSYQNCVFSNSFGVLHVPISFTVGGGNLLSVIDKPGYVTILPASGGTVSGSVFMTFNRQLPPLDQIGAIASDSLGPLPWELVDDRTIAVDVDASTAATVNIVISFSISDRDKSGGWSDRLVAGQMLASNARCPKMSPSVVLATCKLVSGAWEVTRFGRGVKASGDGSELTIDIGKFKEGATVLVDQPEVGGYELASDAEAGTVVITPDSDWVNGDVINVAIFAGY